MIRHLRESGQLTAGLVLRALLSGNLALFEQALAELSGLPLGARQRHRARQAGSGFRALYDKAGLPASAYPAFRAAIEAMREDGFQGRPGGALAPQAAHDRARADAVAPQDALGDVEPLLTLLRRFAAEAAREEARLFCEELVAEAGEPIRAAA